MFKLAKRYKTVDEIERAEATLSKIESRYAQLIESKDIKVHRYQINICNIKAELLDSDKLDEKIALDKQALDVACELFGEESIKTHRSKIKYYSRLSKKDSTEAPKKQVEVINSLIKKVKEIDFPLK